LKNWRDAAAVAKGIAEKYQCPMRARRTFGPEAGLWFMFTEDYLCATITNTEIVHAITDVVSEWQLKRAHVAIDAGIDILMHRGWYETPDYFGGSRYKVFCRPLIEKLANLCHSAGVQLTYQRTQGNTQSIDSLRDLPINHLWGMEPGPGQEDMALLKREIGKQVTFWGGVETTYTLNEGTPSQCRTVVENAIKTLAPGGGFVIMPTAFATYEAPAENVNTAITAAIELGKY
jgi:uroporphyrinogen-III decarboxylase